jgi:hypothetical protein
MSNNPPDDEQDRPTSPESEPEQQQRPADTQPRQSGQPRGSRQQNAPTNTQATPQQEAGPPPTTAPEQQPATPSGQADQHGPGTQTPGAAHPGRGSDGPVDEDVVFQTTPTLRPALLRLGLTVLIGIVAIGVLATDPEMLGTRERTNLGLLLVQALLVIGVARLLIEIMILRRTHYVVTESAVRRQYSLLGRTKAKEVPYGLIRSTERTQNRIEYLLGVGSIRLNQGLGDLDLTALPDHEVVYAEIKERVEQETPAADEASETAPRSV